MGRIVGGILALVLCVSAAEDERQGRPTTPAEQYQALLKEYQDATDDSSKTSTDEERKKIVERNSRFPLRFLELAEENPNDPIAVEALIQVVWLVNGTSHHTLGKDSPGNKAITILSRDHVRSDKLGRLCERIAFGFHREYEVFLRSVFEMNPNRDIGGLACLALARFLNNRTQRFALLNDRPDLAKRYEDLYGKDYLGELQRQNPAKVVKETQDLFEQAADKYGNVKTPAGSTIAELAKTELFELRHLAIGTEAPDIEGEDQDGKRFKLSDYRGKVVLLDFWHQE